MSSTSRREFLKTAAQGAGIAAAPALIAGLAAGSPSDRVNIAVVGFHDRGEAHIREFLKIPNVRVAVLCDVDERLFPAAVAMIEQSAGYRPRTEYDFRRLLESKDVDAVSIATPDHWHALMTIWACQAGKDVYVEKPVSYNIVEGRRMVEAARRHNRIVQAGLNRRSESRARAAIRYFHDGKLGPVYRAKAVILKGRASIGRVPDSAVPEGVHWDLFLGPAPSRPFNLNRFHYGWHFFWDTSTTDVGNSGVHELDLARWGMKKETHPVRVHCSGGLYARDSDQETPNVQTGVFEYSDGTILEVELSNLYTPDTGGISGTGQIFYTTQGYVTSAGGWKSIAGEFVPGSPDVSPSGVNERARNVSFPKRNYNPGPPIPATAGGEREKNHFENFIDCVRSRKREDLRAEILEGHMFTALCHLANIFFRIGRKLTFNPETERFAGDEEANRYLTRNYRAPYVLPEKI